MSNLEGNNVVAFQKKTNKQVTGSTNQVIGQVHTITSIKGIKIFWERDSKPYSCAGNFFRILFATSHVTILCDDSEVDENSLLKVKDAFDEECEITVKEFIRLTAPNPNIQIDYYDEYIISILAGVGIQIGMQTNDSSITEVSLQENEVSGYKPDEILGCSENGDFYVCELYYQKDAPVGYGEPNIFDNKNYSISLLDIILSTIDEATMNGFEITGATLDISYFEANATIVTTIPASFVEEILYSALKRKNPLYQNMRFEKAKEHYFQNEVIKKLKEISMDNE